MFERFSDRARRVVVQSQDEARRLSHDHIGTEHLLLGLLRVEDSTAARALAAAGIDLDGARAEVEKVVVRGESPSPQRIPFTPRAKKVLELALREALDAGDDHIGSDHLLLGLLWEGEGVGCLVIHELGADASTVRAQLVALRPAPGGAVGRLGRGPGPAARRRLFRRVRSEPPTLEPLPVLRRLTAGSLRALELAEAEAVRLGRSGVTEDLVLVGVLAEGEGRGARALAAAGMTLERARERLEGTGTATGVPVGGPVVLLPAALDVLELALVEAVLADRHDIDTEHLLLGVARRAESGAGESAAVLAALGTSADALRRAVADLTGD